MEQRKILFVDDENAISAGAGELLKILGYSVTTHTDPRAAWTMFAADPNAFDVIITDLTAGTGRFTLARGGVGMITGVAASRGSRLDV